MSLPRKREKIFGANSLLVNGSVGFVCALSDVSRRRKSASFPFSSSVLSVCQFFAFLSLIPFSLFQAVPLATESIFGKLGKNQCERTTNHPRTLFSLRGWIRSTEMDFFDDAPNGIYRVRTMNPGERVEKEAETIITRTVSPKCGHYFKIQRVLQGCVV